jgi:hypothetical protein
MQLAGEGDEELVDLGNWFKYQVDIDLPLLSLPYDEKTLLLDINTQNPLKGIKLLYSYLLFFKYFLWVSTYVAHFSSLLLQYIGTAAKNVLSVRMCSLRCYFSKKNIS